MKGLTSKIHRKAATLCGVFCYKALKATLSVSVLLLGVAISGTSVYATYSTISLSISNPEALSIDVTPSVQGSFVDSSNSTINVYTDNFTGYTLKMTSGSSTSLTNGSSSIDSLENNVTESAFSNSTSLNNRWGYKPSQYVTSDGGVNIIHDNTGAGGADILYLPAPGSSVGDVLAVTSTANNKNPQDGTSYISDAYTIAMGARVNSDLKPGVYSNSSFDIIAMANPIVYSISFSDNTGDSSVSGLPTGTGTVSTTDVYAPLPTTVPTRTGYTFAGWCKEETTNNGMTCGSNTPYPASTAGSTSYYEIDQTVDNTDMTFYAVWTPVNYTITVTAGTGISTLALSGWTGSGTGTMTKSFHIGDTINLSTITSAYKLGYSGAKYSLSGSVGSLSGSTYTVGSNGETITVSATDLDTPVCTMTGGTTKVYNRSATTLTATSNTENYDSGVNITYSFGYASSDTANLGNFGSAQAGNTISIAKNAYRGSRYYGVKVVVTDSTDNTITNTCTSGTGSNTGSNVAARTTMSLVNSRIVFDATTNGGTLNGSSSVYVSYGTTGQYTSRTGTTAATIPSANPPTGYTFSGWYNSATDGSKVINTDGTISDTAVSGWTNASKQWVKTGTSNSSTSTANMLYAQYTANSYAIDLNGNGATNSYTTSTTATYNATTLGAIATLPTRSYTISGFTKPASNNADGATVSSTSTLTSNYTFNGWYKESGATNMIASNAATPALQASTTYTNSSSQWTYTTASAVTLYAGWTGQAKTLPTITKTGYTCGWTATATNATTITYASGASLTPSANTTLYGVCTAKTYTVTLNANGGTAGSTSATATYNSNTLSTITNPTRANTTGTRTVSGFTKTTSANNSTVSSTNTLNSTNTTTYTFNGWYKESGATNKIASNATTPVLQASTDYTDANGKWTNDGAVTLYAGWTASAGNYSAVTLPTITRTGSTCGWSTSSTATTITYNSGASFTPTGNTTLYGVCVTNITLNNAGATTAGSTSATVNYNATALSSITLPQRKYTASGFTKTASANGSTVSSTNTLTNTATFNGWYTASSGGTKIAAGGTDTTPDLQASTTYTNSSKQWTYTTAGNITLYSQWTDNAVTLPTITRTGSTCGWATSSTATSWTYNSGASITPTSNLTLYGVCRNNITLNGNGATNSYTTSTTATYNATTLGAIATLPTRSYTVSGFSRLTSAANSSISSTASLTSTYTFNGWYKEADTTNKIASSASTPALQASTTYTDANKKWTYTSANAVTLYAGWTGQAKTLPTITRVGSTCGWATSSTATMWDYASGASVTPTSNMTLYGVCRQDITLDGNGATAAGSTSATVEYNATTLSSITLPQRSYTVSGFSKPSGNNASGATVSSTTTLTSAYTFNGWYKEAATTNLIAGNTTTPALQPSTTYTNSSSKWTYTTAGNVTLYAGWTPQTVTLPTITKSGYTCGWTDVSSGATTMLYASGATVAPDSNKTLYGVCLDVLTVNFEGNSLEFDDGATTNTVLYKNDCGLKYVSAPEYSHTANVSDDGTQNGNYDNNVTFKDVITIPNADSLHLTITYATENNYDMVYVFEGVYDGTVTRNMNAGQLATYMGGSNNTTTVEIDIPGDTTTFAFYSDSSNTFYGYHAKVEGYYNSQPSSYDHTTQTCVRSIVFGDYKAPVNTLHKMFTGWSENSSATTPDYTSSEAVLNNLAGNNGETKTLYAVYDNYYVITFVNTDTGATQTKQVKYGQSGTFTPSTSWSKTNYSLAGWDTNSAGANVVYNKGQSVTLSSDITVYTVWKPAFTVVYDGNGADAGSMTNVKHTNVFNGDTFDLYAPNYSKTGYGFAGWSFDPSAQPGGASKIYGPNEAITITDGVQGGTKTLYAIWVQSSGNLQNWNGCPSMSAGAVIALKDTRDNNVYTVGKLADGNCWMMENLRLNNGASGNADGSLAQGYGSGFVGLADNETANFTNNTNNNTLYSTTNITGSNLSYRFPRYNNSNTASRNSGPSVTDNRSTATSEHTTNLSTNIYSYGNYYTWAAAKANIDNYTSSSTSDTVLTSICPSGWMLPFGSNSGNGNTNGGFYYLGYKVNNNTNITDIVASKNMRTYPNNFVYAGYYSSSSVSSRGASAYYWTSTANSASNSYRSNISSTSISLSATGYKYQGSPVRCLARTNVSIELNGNGATAAGSTSTNVGMGDTTLGTITNPSRSYTISGFTQPASNNANGATVSSTTTLTSTYTFNGWYKEAAATNFIASNATTPVLQVSTDYTDANGKWTKASTVTLYAGWTGQAKTLPTITKAGYTCGWTATATNATTITYASGASLTPSANTTLYGVCTAKTYTVTLNANGGTAGSTSATATYNSNTLSTITNPTRANATGTRTVSGFTKTTSATNATVSSTSTLNSTNTTTYAFNGWYKETGATNKIATNATTPVLQANTSYTDANGKWTNDGAVTLYAGWTASAGNYSAVTLPTITRTGSTCGWSTSSTATTITYNSGASFTPTGNTTLYGVCISSITLTNTNATTNGSTSATAIYGSTTLSSITSPQRKYTFSGFTKTNSAYNATVSATTTKTYTYTFDGWYTASSGGSRVITAAGALVANVSGYTDSSGKWARDTSTTLYAHWTAGTNQTLPTITQTDSTYGNGNCYWSTSNSTTGSQAYASGATISSPTASATLYGVCKFPVKITFSGGGVTKVEVRSGSASGTLVGTVSSSGGSVSNLQYGTNYYLVPTFASYYALQSWAKNSTKGTLSSTTAANPYITIGTTSSTGSVGITITSKSTKVYMWNATSANCGQTLWDNRDGTERSYTTASINGLCWMTTNLALGKSTTTALTSSTSNVSSSGYTLPASSTSGFNSSSTPYIYNSGSTTCSSTSSCYGYYNYAAATAGTNPSSGNATYDICPKGWRLPTSTELENLIATYNTLTLLTASPFKAVKAGYYVSSANPNRGSYGGYWSSTAQSSSEAYYLEYDSTKFRVAYWGYGKQPGYGVRCVAKN